jgi:predicted AAA+ superfamily ATPase
MLNSLVNAGFLQRIAPYGSHYKQVRKPYKYLFASPAFRFLQLSNRQSTASFDNFKGKLLEDAVGLYLRRIIGNYADSSLTYDSSKEGADFIVKKGSVKLIFEVGFGTKGIKQSLYTNSRIKSSIPTVISSSDSLEITEGCLKLPLKYFLLI